MNISVVVPVYKGESFLKEMTQRLNTVLTDLVDSFEIIYVNDNSPDDSWSIIQKLVAENTNVVGIDLSRNFGQHAAISAGLETSVGEYVIVMDCDLQDVPEEIPKLYKETVKGNKVVVAQRINRQDSKVKKLFSSFFYKVLGYLTDIPQDPTIANFGIYHRDVILAIGSLGDNVRYLPTMVRWVGFGMIKVEVVHAERSEGESSYSIKSLLQLGFNVITSFSNKPLRLIIRLGVLMAIGSFIVALVYLGLFFAGKITVLGYSSLIISVWFLSGVVISILGMLGLYVGKLFDQTKNRPHFIIDKKVKHED